MNMILHQDTEAEINILVIDIIITIEIILILYRFI